jgi:hypothetical protein
MAYQYDEFGNVIGEYESEEERRAREQKELDDTAVQTQEIKTYGDGTQEVVTKQEIPPELQRQQQAYAQAVAPVQAPVSPDQAAYTRQQESGGRRDIGYHFQPDAQGKRQSSAFGPYGITEAAYKDIARQDPTLAKPITQWTQEEHDRGYNTLVGRNQARLTQLGIDATPGALQLSHLLGPDGAAKFLKTGQVSESAAAANGGAERLKQIAQGRFAGAPSASSGAAQQAQAQPQAQPAQPMGPVSPEQADQQANILSQQLRQLANSQQTTPTPNSFDEFGTPVFSQSQADLDRNLTNYQEVQDDPSALLNLSKDSTLPEWLKDRSRNRAADLIIEQRQDAKAQKEAAELDENKIARIMRERRGEGSRMKGMLYAAFGLTDLANEEKYKLGIGIDKADTINGQPVIVKVADNGKAIDGISAVSGQPLSAKEIAMYNSNLSGALGKGASVSAEVYVDQKTGQRYRSGVDSSGKSALINIQGGQPFKGNPKDLEVQSIGTAAAKAEAAKKISLAYEPAIAAASKGAATLAEFNALNGTNYAIAGRDTQGLPLLVDQVSGQLLTKPQAGAVTGQAGAPGAPATAAQAGMTPAEVTRQGKTQEAQTAALVKFENEELLPKAEVSQTISRVRKEQIKGPDGILNNPEIASLLQGSSGGEVGNIIRDLITGQFKDQADLSTRVAALNLNDRQKAVLYRQIGLNNQIAPLTLRANAGPGAVSDAEQKANRDANVDITRQPLYSGLSLLTKDQFMKDQQQARAEFRAQNPQFKSTAEFNSAWNAEKSKIDKQYDNIYTARAAYIAKYNPMDKNGKATNPGAVIDAYKILPVPEWNSETRSWDFGTPQAEAFAKKAGRKPLGSFNN